MDVIFVSTLCRNINISNQDDGIAIEDFEMRQRPRYLIVFRGCFHTVFTRSG